MLLYWIDLTEPEKEQAENSFLSIMQDVAFDSDDEWDKDYHKTLAENRELSLAVLEEKTFIRDKDGYIFVNI